MACDVGRGAYVWIAMALRAAVEYSRGESNAMRGERRGSAGIGAAAVGIVVGVAAGAVCAGRRQLWGMGVGCSVGVRLGGMLLRVCR